MAQFSVKKTSQDQIKLIRKYVKLKIVEDNITFRHHSQEMHHVYDLMKRTVSQGESHSALIIGPRGCGKTTMINAVLEQLAKDVDLKNDAIIVQLNGLVHHDEKVALKAITAQMQLENSVGDKVFGSFADNLAFLLSCIKTSSDRKSKSLIFIMDEFHLFCPTKGEQTLLYNLFDVTQSGQSPQCVLGITNRMDIMELLEKRVKSRFSHRHIFIFPNDNHNQSEDKISPVDNYQELMVNLLCVPEGRKKMLMAHGKDQSQDMTNEDSEDPRVTGLEEPLVAHDNGRQLNRQAADSPPLVGDPLIKHEAVKEEDPEDLQEAAREDLKRSDEDDARQEEKDTEERNNYSLPESVLKRCNIDTNYFTAIDPSFAGDWNEHIKSLARNDKVVDALEKLCYHTVDERIFRNALFQTISKLSVNKPYVDVVDFIKTIDDIVSPEHIIKQLQSLSVLELCLVIAMMHMADILDSQPVNAEMVIHRYKKFASRNSSTQTVPRPVILKAFEHLQSLEIIVPIRNDSTNETINRVQEEYKLYMLAVPKEDVKEAVKRFINLPTEISHWANNAIE